MSGYFAKLSLITGTGAVVMVLLMVLTGELVMKWIGEIEALLLLVLQFLPINLDSQFKPAAI